MLIWGFPGGSVVKNLPAMQETRVRSLIGKIPWRRKWQPTPVFLPGESHGQRSLGGYSPWGHKELDTTEQLTLTHYANLINTYITHITVYAISNCLLCICLIKSAVEHFTCIYSIL